MSLDSVSLLPALKIALAAATLLGVDRKRLSSARLDLKNGLDSTRPRCAALAIDYANITEYAKPLEHVVYVESSPTRVYAIVQFFGVLQIWCALSDVKSSCENAAICGVLDPLTGTERFHHTNALNLPVSFSASIPPDALSAGSLDQWIVSGFQRQAIERGAKDLKLRVIEATRGNSDK